MVECIIGAVALAIVLSNSLKTAPLPKQSLSASASLKPKSPAKLTAREKDRIMADRIYEKTIDGTIKWTYFSSGHEVAHYQGFRFFMSSWGKLEITGPSGDVMLQENHRWQLLYQKLRQQRHAETDANERSAEDRFRDSAFEKLGS